MLGNTVVEPEFKKNISLLSVCLFVDVVSILLHCSPVEVLTDVTEGGELLPQGAAVLGPGTSAL